MIDLAELQKTRAEWAEKWRNELPTEEVRQSFLAADAALNDAIQANETEQVAIDEKYLELSAQCFARVSAEAMHLAFETYDAIVELTKALHDEQVAADQRFDECKRLFSANPPSQKALARARDAYADVYGCMISATRPVDVYSQVSHALVGHLSEAGGRHWVKTAYLTPRPRKNGVGNEFDLEEERAIQELQRRQLGPR